MSTHLHEVTVRRQDPCASRHAQAIGDERSPTAFSDDAAFVGRTEEWVRAWIALRAMSLLVRDRIEGGCNACAAAHEASGPAASGGPGGGGQG